MIKNKTVLITGGTGSFGNACVRYLLKYHKPSAIRIFSRDEYKQWQMLQKFYAHRHILRFFLGDVRDKDRLYRSMENVDIVFHAAALKQVPFCEFNPIEAIHTNINGAINVIDAALDKNVDKVISLSSDKASQPINLYGATKLCSDKLFIQANNYRGSRRTKFSVVRYGNVMASRGSVIPLFKKQMKNGEVTITDIKMTRFWITLEEATKFVLSCLELLQGGELFVPKIPSMKLVDLAKAIAPKTKIKVIGIRPGEKLHESLIGHDEALYTYDLGDRYLIRPFDLGTWNDQYPKYKLNKRVPLRFSYTSLNNPSYISANNIRKKLKYATHSL